VTSNEAHDVTAQPSERVTDPLESDVPSAVTIIGCGAVGLPLAVAFAVRGFNVVGVDTDPRRRALLSQPQVKHPDDLSNALNQVVSEGRLVFSSTPAGRFESCTFILAVPTVPEMSEDPASSPELEAAFYTALDSARDNDLLIVRSTVPIGTTRRFAGVAFDRARRLHIACCPDRSISGRSFSEQFEIPHIVGGLDFASTRRAAKLFACLGSVIEVSSPESAEAIKLFTNVQRDTSFGLANQFALICEELGLDYYEICRAGSEGYSRFASVLPGPVGGPCLPKDTFLLAQSVRSEKLVRLPLAARAVNASLLDHVAGAVALHLAAKYGPRTITVLGLAFKGEPRTNDMRGSFGIALADRLRAENPQSEIRTFDPSPADADDGASLARVIRGADILILANNSAALQNLDLEATSALMRNGGLIYDMWGGQRAGAETLANDVTWHAFGKGSRRG
jgi:nucleotide sugar dehydrogenase